VILGFYGVSYYLGFRDEFEVKVDQVVDRICDLEIQSDPRQSSVIVDEIRKVTRTATHMCVYCAFHSFGRLFFTTTVFVDNQRSSLSRRQQEGGRGQVVCSGELLENVLGGGYLSSVW
jgi:hypothetical protein